MGTKAKLSAADDIKFAESIILLTKKKLPEFVERFFDYLEEEKLKIIKNGGVVWEAVLAEITSTLQAEKTSLTTLNARKSRDDNNNNNNNNHRGNNDNNNNSYNNNRGYKSRYGSYDTYRQQGGYGNRTCWQCYGRLVDFPIRNWTGRLPRTYADIFMIRFLFTEYVKLTLSLHSNLSTFINLPTIFSFSNSQLHFGKVGKYFAPKGM